MASMDFVNAKAYLQADFKGTHLYNHLTEVILKLVNDRPKDALGVLEDVSRVVRNSTFSAGSGEGTATKGKQDEDNIAARAKWASNCAALAAVDSTSGYEQISSSMTDALEWAGVALESTEVVLINQALNLMASVQDANNVRFFGKVLGTKADYYVIEVEPKIPVVPKPTAETESKEGANKFVYFVAPSPDAEFVQLPAVKAANVIASTQRKRYLTGNLDAVVQGHPPFVGTEKDLLAAIIARINGDTNLCISGQFAENEDTGDLETPEDYEGSSDAAEQLEANGWNHRVAGLSEANGRAVEFVPEGEEETPEAENPQLRGPEEDAFVYAQASDTEGGAASAKSAKWPGAVAVSDGTSSMSVYIGYGVPAAAQKRFSPIAPPKLPLEYGADEEEDGSLLVEAEDTIIEPEKPEEEEEDPDAE